MLLWSMQIKLLKDTEVPMAHWKTHCECCGPERLYPDIPTWYPKDELLDPDDPYNEIDLAGHKDTFKFGEHYTITQYPWIYSVIAAMKHWSKTFLEVSPTLPNWLKSSVTNLLAVGLKCGIIRRQTSIHFMPTKVKSLPSVTECIAYVESLGYRFKNYFCGGYWFEIIDKSSRPPHNWEMTWTLGEMRNAVKNGC